MRAIIAESILGPLEEAAGSNVRPRPAGARGAGFARRLRPRLLAGAVARGVRRHAFPVALIALELVPDGPARRPAALPLGGLWLPWPGGLAAVLAWPGWRLDVAGCCVAMALMIFVLVLIPLPGSACEDAVSRGRQGGGKRTERACATVLRREGSGGRRPRSPPDPRRRRWSTPRSAWPSGRRLRLTWSAHDFSGGAPGWG